MNALVLAAGEGTRLRPHTNGRPKPMVKVGGKPILSRSFESILDMGLSSAVVVVGYRKDQLIDYFGDSYRGLSIEYVHQEERLGVAHAVLSAGKHIEDDFVVLNGDNVYGSSLADVVSAHRERSAEITMPVESVPMDRARKGAVLDFDNEETVRAIQEKPETPPSRTVPVGMYVLPPAIVPACERIGPSNRGEYELPDAINHLLQRGYSVRTVPYDGRRININTEEDLWRAEQLLDSQRTDE